MGRSQVHVLTVMTSQRKDARLEPGKTPWSGRAGGVCNRSLLEPEGCGQYAPPAPTRLELDGHGLVNSLMR